MARGGKASYIKGATFERRVLKQLEKQGWHVVRNPASKFPDLTAIRIGGPDRRLELILCECKWNGNLPKEDKEKFVQLIGKFKGFDPYINYCVASRSKNKEEGYIHWDYILFSNIIDWRSKGIKGLR